MAYSRICSQFVSEDDYERYSYFPVLEEASYVLLKEQDKNLKIFSKEINNANKRGAKWFRINSTELFWNSYRKRNNEKMWYEVIRKGQPCRLYFNLEYEKNFNPTVNCQKLTEDFVKYICGEIKENFKLDCSIDNVVQLDSSKGEKFSRHLIFHLPKNKVFRNSSEVYEFVKACLCKLYKLKKSNPGELRKIGLENFFHRKQYSSGGKEIFCDCAVYRRNHNFRLFLSNESGKNNPFLLAEDCTFYKTKPTYEKIFKDSLIEVLNVKPSQFLHFERKEEIFHESVSTLNSNTNSFHECSSIVGSKRSLMNPEKTCLHINSNKEDEENVSNVGNGCESKRRKTSDNIFDEFRDEWLFQVDL